MNTLESVLTEKLAKMVLILVIIVSRLPYEHMDFGLCLQMRCVLPSSGYNLPSPLATTQFSLLHDASIIA